MAVLNLKNPLYYKGGAPYASKIVGNDTIKADGNRVGRFEFTSPSEGASRIEFCITNGKLSSQSVQIPMQFYIGTDESSHANAWGKYPTLYESHGEVTATCVSGQTYAFTGSADVLLKPDAKYYLWIFPGDTGTSDWCYYSLEPITEATITTTGSYSHTVRVRHVRENGWTVFSEGGTVTVLHDSFFTPATVTPPAENTTDGSWFKWWTEGYGAELGRGDIGKDGITVTQDIVVEVYYPVCVYKLTTACGKGATVLVTRGGAQLESGADVRLGDVLTVEFGTAEGYTLTTHTVNGEAFASGESHTVAGAVTVTAEAFLRAYPVGDGLYHASIGGTPYTAYIGNENGKPIAYGTVKEGEAQ